MILFNQCPLATESQCLKMLESKYKFYLSFENAVCEDYVTEKFFKVLNYNIIPIVLGGANYSKFAPSKSYIDVRDFQSVGQLAEYLQYLNKNETAYSEYFEWKSYFRVVVDYKNVFCHLCQVILKKC
jgi:alpha-1,3-fucosyltransferase